MKKSLPKFAKVQGYWRRQGFVKFIFMSLFIAFSYYAVLNSQNKSVQNKADKQAKKTQLSIARRGDIVDRHGNILASSRLLKQVILDPSNIHKDFIPELAKALEIDQNILSKQLIKKKQAGSRYLLIKKNLTLDSLILEKLNAFKKLKINVCRNKKITEKLGLLDEVLNIIHWQNIKGKKKTISKCRREKIRQALVLQQTSQRYYPKSSSIAPIIGRMNAENKGSFGIENEFENTLSGVNGKTSLNFSKNKIYFNPQVKNTLRHGDNIELTIDSDIQYYAYEAMKKSVLKHEADSGSAIILAANGEVLAMVNYPADDPNDKSLYNPSHYRNRVLSDKVEPGSTIKPFTMLLALEQGKISTKEGELIDVSKTIGHIKTNKKVRKYGDAINIKKILQKSHNLGTVNVSERLSKKDMYNTWYKLGFSQPLGLIPSIENSGSLRHFSSWGLADKRTLSFGYGPMETNLAQLARAYLVFANEGVLPPLKLIKNMPSYAQNTQVFSKQTTAKIANLLDAVVSWGGSGYRARIKGYSVAGKTGTAEMVVDGKYNKEGAKRTFFVGFTPVKKPKYIMAIRLDHPKKCYAYKRLDIKISCEGSNSAAMVFSDTMKAILNHDTLANTGLK